MFSVRIQAVVSTALLVIGAFLVGDVLHSSMTVNAFGITSLAAVSRIGGGGLLIGAGYLLQRQVDEHTTLPSEADTNRTPETTFDPKLSPLGDSEEHDEEL